MHVEFLKSGFKFLDLGIFTQRPGFSGCFCSSSGPSQKPCPCQASHSPALVTSDPVLLAPGAATSFIVSSYAGDPSSLLLGLLLLAPPVPVPAVPRPLPALLCVHGTSWRYNLYTVLCTHSQWPASGVQQISRGRLATGTGSEKRVVRWFCCGDVTRCDYASPGGVGQSLGGLLVRQETQCPVQWHTPVIQAAPEAGAGGLEV